MNKFKKILLTFGLISITANSSLFAGVSTAEFLAEFAKKTEQWAKEQNQFEFDKIFKQDQIVLDSANNQADSIQTQAAKDISKVFGNSPMGTKANGLLEKCLLQNKQNLGLKNLQLPQIPKFEVCGQDITQMLSNQTQNQNQAITSSGNMNTTITTIKDNSGYSYIPTKDNTLSAAKNTFETITDPEGTEQKLSQDCQNGYQTSCIRLEKMQAGGAKMHRNNLKNLKKGGSGGGLSSGGAPMSQGTSAAVSEHYSNLEANEIIQEKNRLANEKLVQGANNLNGKVAGENGQIDLPPEAAKDVYLLVPDTIANASTQTGTKTVTKYKMISGEDYIKNKEKINSEIKQALNGVEIDLTVMNHAKLGELVVKAFNKDKESWNTDSDTDVKQRTQLAQEAIMNLTTLTLFQEQKQNAVKSEIENKYQNYANQREMYNQQLNIDNNALLTEILKSYK